jgi:hypothetical protein
LDEFCFRHKRIEKIHLDYARNSYRDGFIDFPPCSYSRVLPHSYSHALSQFAHGSNHHSYGFGHGPHPHHGDRFSRRPDFSVEGSQTHFEPTHLDGPRFPRRGSRPTRSSDMVQKTVKTS